MKKLVEKILLGAVIITALCVVLALLCFFASISAGSISASGAEGFTKAASGLFGFSRVGLIVALLLAAIYAGLWVDWSGEAPQEAVKPPAPKPEGGEDFTD